MSGTALWIVGLGSNVEPERNVPRMLAALLGIAPRVVASRVVATEPQGLLPGESGRFLNLAVALECASEPAAFKKRLESIEAALGRDRSDPERRRRSRTADLDPLLRLDPGTRRVDPSALPREPYQRTTMLELLDHLGIDAGAPPPPLPAGVPLRLGATRFGSVPTTMTSSEGER